MKYANAVAFRRALETRLRTLNQQQGIPLVRLRKLVSFDRLLARLVQTQPEAWIMKGGLALQLRLGARARTTKDMDLLLHRSPPNPYDLLARAASIDLADWFQFLVEQPGRSELPEGGKRFSVQALLDSRPFEKFHIDIGVGDVLVEPAQYLTMPPLLDFAQIAPTVVPCYPVTQQMAEKIHAYTRPHATGGGTRVKDLVDILLLAGLEPMTAASLRQALVTTFALRMTHPLPQRLPAPPVNWTLPFRRLAQEVYLPWQDLEEAYTVAAQFLDVILVDTVDVNWDPATWAWQPASTRVLQAERD